MHFKKVAVLLFCSLLPPLHAQLVSEVLQSFPVQTESVEYDNLAALRALPNYGALKQRFSGKPLQRLQTALTQIGVQESAVEEIAMATGPDVFYGLIAGTFDGPTVTKEALRKGCAFVDVGDLKILAPTSEMSVLFLGKSLAAFGTPAQIKSMLEARNGHAPKLNAVLGQLLRQTDSDAPVRGVSSGTQIAASLAEAMQGETTMKIDWSRLASNVSALAYSVKLDTKAHVAARLQCQSSTAAILLHQMLSALSALQSVSSSAPFQNLEVSSTGVFVDLKLDTPLPVTAAAQ